MEIGDILPPCLEEHDKPSVLRLIAPAANLSGGARAFVPSGNERKGTKSAPVFMHTLMYVCSACNNKCFRAIVLGKF